jgi:pimeloyl-ACP methyl ester carboxylesterase
MTPSLEVYNGLAYQSLSPTASTTIVLVHGAFATSADWDLVAPHLGSYHLLIPDNPGHGQSSTLPFSVDSSARLIAQLIAEHANSGQAHIVGHSLGAKIAIRLAEKYPDAVLTVLVSGYEMYPSLSSPALPYLLWTMTKVNDAVPRSLIRWAMDGTDLRRSKPVPFSLYRQIAGSEGSCRWPEPWPAKTLVIAAGKGSWFLPSYDHPEDAKRLAGIGTEARAVTHTEMRHPWNRQAPALFGEVVVAWIEGREIPGGFEVL